MLQIQSLPLAFSMNCFSGGVRLRLDGAYFYQTLVWGDGEDYGAHISRVIEIRGDLNSTQTFGHVHEIHKRFSSHLLHDLPAVLLDGDFAVIKLERDLFVK
jgi:hypothetical protein